MTTDKKHQGNICCQGCYKLGYEKAKQEILDKIDITNIAEIVSKTKKELIEEFEKMINFFENQTIKNKEQIINEGDLQSGAIEFSYTGELFPVEKLEYEIDYIKRLIQALKSQETKSEKVVNISNSNLSPDIKYKELQSKIIKEIDTIETEYPDDDGTPFRISPEQFKRELKSKLNKLFEKGK